MAEFKVRTRGNADPQGKPRAYFTCHPEDFCKYFDKICSDVLENVDCAIYYTADMTEPLDETNIEVDLGRMNLFLVPITFRLLKEENRAMSVDVAFAKEMNIPILPFMMEREIDSFYSKPECFGERQYLSPYSTDESEISYNEKLKKYLDAVLISDEMACRIRAAFDAYIFLSYRKKDRRYANELMRIIHSIPGCRDIAVWYDEFLTPGESFMENISKAMEQSRLFTLLVTPNVLEDGNFVMSREYPAARQANMKILPAEMEQTDHDELSNKFLDIPECVYPSNVGFDEILLEAISKIAKTDNDNDPAHNFLIGLAYLEGIDVEVNRDRGIELITSAAEAGLPEAMEKLYNIHVNGTKSDFDVFEAQRWAGRLADYYISKYGEEHPKSLLWMHNLCYTYQAMGKYREAQERGTRIYELKKRVYGEEHLETLLIMNNLALVYRELGNPQKQHEMLTKIYETSLKTLGEEHPKTLLFLRNLAYGLQYIGDFNGAKDLHERAYEIKKRTLGEEHTDTVASLSDIALCYMRLGERVKALEIQEKVCEIYKRIHGDDNLVTLDAFALLGLICSEIGNLDRAREISILVYEDCRKSLGEGHPATINAMNTLGLIYFYEKKYTRALSLFEPALELYRRYIAVTNSLELLIRNNIALCYMNTGRLREAIEIQKVVCKDQTTIFGEDHPNSLLFKGNLAAMYGNLRQHKDAIPLHQEIYEKKKEILGETHPETVMSLYNLATGYSNLRRYKQACELLERVYEIRKSNPNERVSDLLVSARMLAAMYIVSFRWGKAWGMLKEFYRLSSLQQTE